MTQAQPPTYQCLVTPGFYQQGQNAPMSQYCSLFLPGGDGNGVEYPGNQSSYMQFWVMLDQNPLNPPQQFVAPDYSTVPPGLAQLMDAKHILVACITASASNAPSGALFEFLMANGSGNALNTLDQLNTNLACGVGAQCFYAMVSIPGQGPQSGIEFFVNPAPVTYADASQTAWAGSFPFNLVPDGIGGYVPYASL